ncbi:AAA family ATPase [Streptomyces sp. SP18CS02]|uniref:AAA family ATPase n=1 Tax=Streptomyces sp. SP18CS02 TaxID=3002531 RepID=UPI002E75A11F|nr:AAA family ATPase [Streptomyces sp. SP18CS02]MEE1753903.1 NB-ARC domain-containing protein [Streptomyces sp. SP18CS02]
MDDASEAHPPAAVRNEVTDARADNVIQSGTIGAVTINAPTRSSSALRGLRPRPHTVIGRDDALAVLLGRLEPSAPRPHAVAITGQGGVGKTVLALEAAHEAVDRGWFPGDVLYADARAHHSGRRAGFEELLDGFLRMLGTPAADIPAHRIGLEALLRSALIRHDERHGAALILVDDAVSAAELVDLLPSSTRHRLVVTTRQGPSAHAELAVLPLGVLGPADSRDLLRSGRSGGADEAELDELAMLCGHLPLALGVALATANEDGGNLLPLLSRLREQRERLAELGLDALYDASYQTLPPEDARLLRMLGLHPATVIDVASAAALAGRPEAETGRGLRRLRQANLLLAADRDGRVRFHDLTRLYAEKQLAEAPAPDRLAALERLLAHFAARAEEPHWLDDHHGAAAAAVDRAVTEGLHGAVEPLAEPLTAYLTRRAHTVDALVVLRGRAVAARHRGDHFGEIRVLDSMSELYAELGFRGHSKDCDRTADILRDRHRGHSGRNHRRTTARLADMKGRTASLRQDHEEAVSHFLVAQRLWERLGQSRKRIASLCELGRSYRALGQDGAADTTFRDVLRLAEETDSLPGAARAHQELADMALARRDPGSASRHAAAALQRVRRTGDRKALAAAHAVLARIALANGDLDTARTQADLAFDITLDHGLVDTDALEVSDEVDDAWRAARKERLRLLAGQGREAEYQAEAEAVRAVLDRALARREAYRGLLETIGGQLERQARMSDSYAKWRRLTWQSDEPPPGLPQPPPPPPAKLPAPALVRLALGPALSAVPLVAELLGDGPHPVRLLLWAVYLCIGSVGTAVVYGTLTRGRTSTREFVVETVWLVAALVGLVSLSVGMLTGLGSESGWRVTTGSVWVGALAATAPIVCSFHTSPRVRRRFRAR